MHLQAREPDVQAVEVAMTSTSARKRFKQVIVLEKPLI